jgi:hydroxypyruvate isomerase
MPKLAANVSTLFKETDFLSRFARARQAGFRAVEYQYPYECQPEEVARAARDAGVPVVLHNMPRGEAEKSEHGTACLPGREARFREDLERAIAYARPAGCKSLHVMAGVPRYDADLAECHRVYVANVKHAARRLKREGMRVLIEPLSEKTVAGCFLKSSAQAVRVLDEAGEDNAFLQYDFFHMQIMEGNLAATFERLRPRIGHLQLADVPDRHEPGTGEINYDFLLKRVDDLKYEGWIGCEYTPKGDTVEGLKWATRYLS